MTRCSIGEFRGVVQVDQNWFTGFPNPPVVCVRMMAISISYEKDGVYPSSDLSCPFWVMNSSKLPFPVPIRVCRSGSL